MNETETRAVLLMRAFEQTRTLSADDAAWAGREARRQLGEAASAEVWLARRARLGLDRLAERDRSLLPAMSAALRAPDARWAALLLSLALLLGLVGESLGAARHINLLAMPLLGLLAWNLAVYLALAWRSLRARPASRSPGVPHGWLRWRGWVLQRLAGGAATARAGILRYGADWLALSAPLQAARAAAWLHAAAAALAVGAVASMYARGLVFDYQAGWDSTFLQPAAVRRVLGWVLGPASAISGLGLPDAEALAALRLSAGGGEGAAAWIHRWALTLLLAVVLPRAALAGIAHLRARRLAGRLPLPDDLLRDLPLAPGAPPVATRRASVLPYSYQLDAAHQAALEPGLQAWLGPGLKCQALASLPLGAEDDLHEWLPAVLGPADAPPDLLVVLFALTATPERENHGALVAELSRALAAAPAPRPELRVAVDESGFRQRLAGADGSQRLAQRRAAWQALLAGEGVAPGFIDLSSRSTILESAW